MNILFISSFSKDTPAQIAFETGLSKALQVKEGKNRIFFEFMERPRLDERNVSSIFAPHLKNKYRDIQIDCVIGWAPPAILFLITNKNLFTNAYTVYVEPGGLKLDQKGVFSERESFFDIDYDQDATLSEIMRLENPKKIYVIGTSQGSAASSRLKRFRSSFGKLSPIPEIEYLLDLKMEEVATRLSSVPEKDAVAIYLLMFSDGAGKRMVPYEVARYLTKSSAIPMYSYWASLMGSGIVGGYLFTHERVGFELGRAIPRIVNGENIDAFPTMQHIYDWTQLDRWKINESQLPEGSILINRPPDIWARYRNQIVSGLIFLALQSLMIVLLLGNITRRKKAEQELLAYQKQLEERVQERTGSLNKANQQLQEEISVRKQAEQTLRESEEKFRGIVENSKGIAFVIDKNGFFTVSEGLALSGLGLKPGEVVGMSAYEIYKDYPAIISALDKALSGETVHDPHLVVQGINEEKHFNIFYTSVIVGNEIAGLIGEAIDITETVKAAENLRVEKERAQNYLDIAATMIVAFDKEGKVTLINKRGCKILGYEEEEILGKNWIEHFVPEHQINHALETYQQTTSGNLDHFKSVDDFPILTANGEEKLISWHNSLIKNADGHIVGSLSSGIDITHSRKIEQEREKLIKELKEALSQIKTLSGFLPICASCKKIRDDDGFWLQIESYIEDHSDALFSHSVCPECMEELYPKTHKKLKKEGKI